MAAHEIRTGQDLTNYLRAQSDDIAALRGATMASIGDALNGRLVGSADRAAFAGKLGAFAKNVALHKTSALAEMGAGGSLPGIDRGVRPHDGVVLESGLDGVEMKAALGTPIRGDSVTGSYTVPQEYAKEVLRIAEAQSDLMRLVRRVPMTTRSMLMPVKAAGVAFSWPTNQTSDLTEANPTFGLEEMTCKTAALWLGVSEELMEDNNVVLGTYLMDIIIEAWVAAYESAFLTSTTPWTGLLADTDVLQHTMSAGSPGFGDMDVDDLDALIAKLTKKSYRNNAYFIAHPTIIDVIAQCKDANGNFKWQQTTASQPSSIRGYRYISSDNMPDLTESAPSTPFMLFGRPDLLIFGDRIALELKYYDGTQYAVTNAQCFFRARVRGAFLVPHPTAWARLRTAAG